MAASKRKGQSEGIFIGLICVVVILAGILLFSGPSYRLAGVQSQSVATTPIQYPNLTISDGTLNANFPQEFIIDPSAKILSSSDNPDATTGIHTTAAVFQSNESVDALYSAYVALLSPAPWQVVSKQESSGVAALVAEDSATHESIGIQINSNSPSTIVVVSFQSPLSQPGQ